MIFNQFFPYSDKYVAKSNIIWKKEEEGIVNILGKKSWPENLARICPE